MAIKLDMSNAYDRVEWRFLKEVMLRMGFVEEWADLIMKCVSSATFAVNNNGKRGKLFSLQEGCARGTPESLPISNM